MTRRVVWISGASSGIGAALASSLPWPGAELIGVSRRRPAVGRHLRADLASRDGWADVTSSFDSVFAQRPDEAVFAHMAATPGPHARSTDADRDEYAAAVLVNGAAPLVLGAAFLGAAERHDVRAALVLCSSPAAARPMRGMSSYGSGKAAVEYWVGCVAAELENDPRRRVIAVVPHAVDTPMVREVMSVARTTQPVAAVLADAAARGALATPESTAAAIWRAVETAPSGSIVPVGAVPD